MTQITSILIANRGEIACRIMRTAKAMGIETVAVYSDADADAPHVKIADKAVHIGPSPVGESYLVADKIIEAAKSSGADAIHPGYGFLSENAEFARSCANAGLVFIGPKPDAIELMGDKAQAKRRMIEAGVPCVPGYQGEDQSDATLIAESENIGFPIMVKAAAGGGGRGMRLVSDAKALPDAIKDARSEAKNAFGDDTLILEKAVQNPRHVEIQIFADTLGNTIHLGERDCSVQRRHQKVLEEAPCPVMTPDLRKAMGQAAVKAAKDIGYVGAGTVEFLLDQSGDFYFLEMNTRLQVEHPVTELVTRLDLVEMQIRVARGERLPVSQADIQLTGHAIEARLYAEDTQADFLPATGPVNLWTPASGQNIRVDSGIETGSEISPFYDPMIAKVMAYGATRDEVRLQLIQAFKDTAIFGVKTNRGFLIDALEHAEFARGEATTAFITDNFDADSLSKPISDMALMAGAVLQFELARHSAMATAPQIPDALMGWSSATLLPTPFAYVRGDEVGTLNVTSSGINKFIVELDEASYEIELISLEGHRAQLKVDDAKHHVLFFAENDATLHLSVDSETAVLTNQNAIFASAADAGGAGQITAPMHGALIEVFVSEGDTVTSGHRLAVLEAMKMQHEITADIDGTLSALHVSAGSQIAADTLMFEIESPEE